MEGNQPYKKIRAGNITGTAWKNVSEKGTFFNITIEKSYKDNDGNWKSTTSFGHNELPKVRLVAESLYAEIFKDGQSE